MIIITQKNMSKADMTEAQLIMGYHLALLELDRLKAENAELRMKVAHMTKPKRDSVRVPVKALPN